MEYVPSIFGIITSILKPTRKMRGTVACVNVLPHLDSREICSLYVLMIGAAMARHKRYENINGSDLRELDACAEKLKAAGRKAMTNLVPSGLHYAAVLELNQAAVRALNVLNGRPADHEKWGR
jgi:hypothetical protein